MQHDVAAFCNTIWQFYTANKRAFAWRQTVDPYHILVSEVMLQQTQTHRVAPRYVAFITTFPTIAALAHASLKDVLTAWQGLGYNRRGKFLHMAAQQITLQHNGILPASPALLVQLPGIGKATAASICAFAFNMPTIFVETNIRTVFIHHFFKEQEAVHDNDIALLVAQTVDQQNPREWYYALMDYGVWLKKQSLCQNKKSKHYTKQSPFAGSARQLRGAIIRALTQQSHFSIVALQQLVQHDKRFNAVLDGLVKEGFVVRDEERVLLR